MLIEVICCRNCLLKVLLLLLITGILSLFGSLIFLILSRKVLNFTSILLSRFTWGLDYLYAHVHLDLRSYFCLKHLLNWVSLVSVCKETLSFPGDIYCMISKKSMYSRKRNLQAQFYGFHVNSWCLSDDFRGMYMGGRKRTCKLSF
jgi:hypothetical protein